MSIVEKLLNSCTRKIAPGPCRTTGKKRRREEGQLRKDHTVENILIGLCLRLIRDHNGKHYYISGSSRITVKKCVSGSSRIPGEKTCLWLCEGLCTMKNICLRPKRETFVCQAHQGPQWNTFYVSS